ncbi:MAG: hypothetical protein WA063_05805 [Minisyncoccia bacterium]
MTRSLQDKDSVSKDVKKIIADRSGVDGWDEDKRSIGEMIREMNIPQTGTPGAKAVFEAPPDLPKPILKPAGDKAEEDKQNARKTQVIKAKQEEETGKEGKGSGLEKQNFELLINSLRQFVHVLREREGNRLNVLIPKDKSGIITKSTNVIERMLGEKNADFAEFNAEIMKITSALETIGSTRQRGGAREDTKNLGRAKVSLGQIELGCHNVIIGTKKDGSSEIKAVMASVGKLFDVAQAKKLYITQLLAAFDEFHRRR